ncbi:hypothetical protein SS209_02106 [Salmonella enterica subsp. enterica serovar Senftenberg str. SS209]|nr:hypothetical protein SS209_02106 [Salmonella enterica subsp. enterica serovar Senftenberg str. SS209]
MFRGVGGHYGSSAPES